MAICKFFQQGHCRKGSTCDFEHIKGDRNPFANVQPVTPQEGKGHRKSNRKPGNNNNQSASTTKQSPNNNKKNTPNNPNSSNDNYQKPKNSATTQKPQKSRGKPKHKKSYNSSGHELYKSKSTSSLPGLGNSNRPEASSSPRIPSVKDYVNMVLSDLSERPVSWYFSSYGLTLSPSQSLPFPFLGTTELSAEELRLQIYAEAAATGGRVDNYLKVVEEIKKHAELQTKSLIPHLETAISDLLRSNNISMGPTPAVTPAAGLHQQQEALKQTLQQRMNYIPDLESSTRQTPPEESMLLLDPLRQSAPTQQQALQPQNVKQQQPSSNEIIPDDFFAFGSIPEMPPPC